MAILKINTTIDGNIALHQGNFSTLWVETILSAALDTKIPTSKAVADYVTGLGYATTSALSDYTLTSALGDNAFTSTVIPTIVNVAGDAETTKGISSNWAFD